MENAEEIKVKRIRVELSFDSLFRKAIKKGLLNYNSEEDISTFRRAFKGFSCVKSAFMWKTVKAAPADLDLFSLIPQEVKKQDIKYITSSAFNPNVEFDLPKASPLELFVFDEFTAALRRLSVRVVRDEAKAERFEIVEVPELGAPLDYSRIGIIRSGENLLPFGSSVVSNLWLKK